MDGSRGLVGVGRMVAKCVGFRGADVNTISRLADEMTLNVFLPALLLVSMIAGFVWVIHRSTHQENFDVSQFLRDPTGKLSSGRLFAFVALGIHTWAIGLMTLEKTITENILTMYALTWSGSAVLKAGIEQWGDKRSAGK